jgi:integrase
LRNTGVLDGGAAVATQVTPENIDAYVTSLKAEVSSVSTWLYVYRVRRAAELLAPHEDFGWLTEIERDLAFVMEPRSKLGRVVFAERLVEAGLTLITEAKEYSKREFSRALAIRDGLMLALLALCPIRRKNFASLEIGKSFREIDGRWWIMVPARETKMKAAPEERPIPSWLNPYIEIYLRQARPVLLNPEATSQALWLSSVTHERMRSETVWKVLTKVTRETIGIAISPHLFRTADATTAADARSDMPHLASALLGHRSEKVTEEHYNRASSLSAAKNYAEILASKYSAKANIEK